MSSNLELLEKLTLGKNDVKRVTITLDGEDYPFTIRPLTDGELTQLKAMEKKAFDFNINLGKDGKRVKSEKDILSDQKANVNPAEFSLAQSETKYMAIKYGLNVDNEEIPLSVIKNLRNGVPDLLFEEIIKISNLEEYNLTTVQNFRKNQ